jgi:hypothetical protein
MFIPFTPHRVKLKPDTIKELVKQKILLDEEFQIDFPVIAMDIKTEKQSVVDKEKIEDEEEEGIHYKEIEVSEIMLLIGIENFGYHWVDQDEIIFLILK